MGLQDREWYWEAKREKELEAQGRAKRGLENILRGLSRSSAKVGKSQWHWSLQVLLFALICFCVYGFFRILKTLTA